MAEIIYTVDGEVASFPYHFEIKKHNDDDFIGEVTAYIWKDLQVPAEKRSELQKELTGIPAQSDSGFRLEKNEIIYQSRRKITGTFNCHDEEVDIRRHFIEDYLEAVRDLTRYAEEFKGITEKTEFIN